MTVPAPIRGLRVHDGRRINLGGVWHQLDEQLRFGDELITDIGRGLRPGHRFASLPQRHLKPQAVTRHDLPPKLGVVHAAQRGARDGLAAVSVKQEQGRDLHEALDHQDARHQRRARKVALKELLVDSDVLYGHEPPARLVLNHRIDQE